MARRDEFTAATRRAAKRRAAGPIAVAARYDRRRDRIIVSLNTGLELAFPPRIAQGLERAAPAELSTIELSPSGFGIHFPKLDAHLYLPALLQGVFGSKAWMAAQLGAAGGLARSLAKTAAARANGRRGGRPRKIAAR
jgi:uncharacterized protein DUF2442